MSNSNKQLVYVFSDNFDISELHINHFDDIKNIIDTQVEHTAEDELKNFEFTIKVKRMTQEELDKLPEWDG